MEIGEKAAGEATPVLRRDAINWIILLLMCTAQYWTVLTHDTDLHFQSATAIFFFAMTAFLVNTIRGAQEPASALALNPADVPIIDATAQPVPEPGPSAAAGAR
jgi:hypothetical protein